MEQRRCSSVRCKTSLFHTDSSSSGIPFTVTSSSRWLHLQGNYTSVYYEYRLRLRIVQFTTLRKAAKPTFFWGYIYPAVVVVAVVCVAVVLLFKYKAKWRCATSYMLIYIPDHHMGVLIHHSTSTAEQYIILYLFVLPPHE